MNEGRRRVPPKSTTRMASPGRERALAGPGRRAEWRAAATLVVLCAAPWAMGGPDEAGATAPPAVETVPDESPLAAPPSVPEEALARMAAQMVGVDAPLGVADKERRYRAILREGEAAERKYPGAANLHAVRNLMLDAAIGLAHIRADAQLLDRVRALARGILASDAPQAAKAKADAVLAEEALAKVEPPPETEALLRAMVNRYADTEAAAAVLQWAANIASVRKQPELAADFARRLARDHADEPGVIAFVQRFINYSPPICGRRLEARLPRLDGQGEVVLPADAFGRPVLIHFWRAADPGSAAQTADLKRRLQAYRDDGLLIIAVSLDRSRQAVQKAVRDLGADWVHVFSGQGDRDPFVIRCGVTGPAYLLLDVDGTVSRIWWQSAELLDPRWRDGAPLVNGHRFLFFRSGEFLLDGLLEGGRLPADAARDLPNPLAEALGAQVFSARADLPADRKAARSCEFLRLAGRVETECPGAAGLPLLRALALIAAEWLAVHERPASAAPQMRRPDAPLELARRILASSAPPQARLFADYLVTRQALRASEPSDQEADAALKAFVQRSAGADEADLSILAAMLALQFHPRSAPPFIETLRRKQTQRLGVPTFLGVLSRRDPLIAAPFEGELTDLVTGRAVRLPHDMTSAPFAVCFWSRGRPPPDWLCQWRSPRIVGISLDESREAALAFARDHCPYWTHTFSGRGPDDGTARRCDVYDLPSLWHVTPDRRTSARYDLARAERRSPLQAAWQYAGSFLGPEPKWPEYPRQGPPEGWADARRQKVLTYYDTGEFLLEALVGRDGLPLGGDTGLPQADVKALNAEMIRPHMDASDEEKARRCRAILRLGAHLEQARPRAPGLAAVRNLMMIAARWLAVHTGDAAADETALAVARRLMASDAPLEARLLADGLVLADELRTTTLGIREAADRLRQFQRRHEAPYPAYSKVLASRVSLSAWRTGDDSPRLLVSELCTGHWGRMDAPWTRTGLYFVSLWPAKPSWDAQPDLRRFEATLDLLEGGRLAVPEDLLGKSIIVHFWTLDAPPADVKFAVPRGVAVVAVNLDPERRRREVQAYAREPFPRWVHAFSGKGFDDPAARRYDIHLVPSTTVIGLDGRFSGRLEDLFTPHTFAQAVACLRARQYDAMQYDRTFRGRPAPPNVSLYERLFIGRPFAAALSSLWGDGDIHLPRDLAGKAAVVHFWEARQGLLPLWDQARRVEAAQQAGPGDRLALVSVGFGASRDEVRQVWGKPRQGWTEAFSLRGYEDPVLDGHGIWALPAFWLIGPDGRVCWYGDAREDQAEWAAMRLKQEPPVPIADEPIDRLPAAVAEWLR